MWDFIKQLLCKHDYKIVFMSPYRYYHDDAHNLLSEMVTGYTCTKCGRAKEKIDINIANDISGDAT